MSNDLELLGLDKEQITDLVVEGIVKRLLTFISYDEDGEGVQVQSSLRTKLDKAINEKVNDAIGRVVEKYLKGATEAAIEAIVFAETNRYGEKTGKAYTFREYLIARTEEYLNEVVDHNGKTKGETRYEWNKRSTRVVYLVHEHMQSEIDAAMKEALTTANTAIVGGIKKAVEISLEQIKVAARVEVK